MPKISVILPVYNTEEQYLLASVKSVITQTYRDFELIIVDDGSGKKVAELCDRLSEFDKRIRVIHIDSSGVAAARNRGLDESEGDFIAFIDSDDTMCKHFLEIMINEINDVDFTVCRSNHVKKTITDRNDIHNGSIIANRENCINFLCYMNPPYNDIETNSIWGKMYKKSLIGSIRLNERMVMAEDFEFNFNYLQKNNNGKYLNYSGYNYLERPNSMSRNYNPKMVFTIDEIENLAKKFERTEIYEPLISRCVNIAFTILMMIPDSNKADQKRVIEFINKHRNNVIRNPKTKRKVKAAIFTSYFGYGITKSIFEMKQN